MKNKVVMYKINRFGRGGGKKSYTWTDPKDIYSA